MWTVYVNWWFCWFTWSSHALMWVLSMLHTCNCSYYANTLLDWGAVVTCRPWASMFRSDSYVSDLSLCQPAWITGHDCIVNSKRLERKKERLDSVNLILQTGRKTDLVSKRRPLYTRWNGNRIALFNKTRIGKACVHHHK